MYFSFYRTGVLRCAMLLLCFFALPTVWAQTPQNVFEEIRQQVGYTIQPLNKSQIPTGYLHEYGYLFYAPDEYKGIRTDTNHVQPLKWEVIYGALYSSYLYGTQSLPDIESVRTQLKPYKSKDGTIALPILLARQAKIRQDAEVLNLITFVQGKYYDVVGRSQSPYETNDVFLVAPTREVLHQQSGSFVFRSDLFYSNYGILPAQIQTLQADFADGQGYRTMAWNVPAQVSYPEAGIKVLKYRITLAGGAIREGHSILGVEPNPVEVQSYGFAADATIPFDKTATSGGGLVSIVYSVKNTAKKLKKPFIVAEGFDQYNIADLVKTTNNDLPWFVKLLEQSKLNDPQYPNSPDIRHLFDDISEYDLVFLDYANGAAAVRENAELFIRVVEKVNELKAQNNSTAQNVVLGLSMGGLVTRYGLAKMVKAGKNPQVRVLATYDSPHRGANIPLGMQVAMRQLGEVKLLPLVKLINLGENGNRLEQGLGVYDSPAVKDLLLYRATNDTGNLEYNTFIEGEYRQMVTGFVMPYKFITLSAGSECAEISLIPHSTLIDAKFNYGVGNYFFTDMLKLKGWLADLLAQYHPAYGNNNTLYWTFNIETRALPEMNAGNREISHVKINLHAPGLRKLIERILKTTVSALLGKIVNYALQIVELIPVENKIYHAPYGLKTLDGAAGGVIKSEDLLPLGYTPTSFVPLTLGMSTPVTYPANRTCFIPVPSALDIPVTTENLKKAYNSDYLPSNSGSQTQKFLTQEYSSWKGTEAHNREHDASPTSRLALWMYREMEGLPQTQVCGRPCSPTFPPITTKGTICVGESNPIYLDLSPGMSVFWNTSPGLSVVYQGNPTRPHLVWNGTGGNGYGWIEPVLTTNAECTFYLPRQNVWKGKPNTSYTLIAPYKKVSGIYIFCPNQTAKFTFQIPNNNPAGIQRYECMVDGCVVSQETTDGGDRTELTFTVVGLNDLEDCLSSVSVRAVNECGEGNWQSIPFLVTNFCNIGLDGSPCPPRVACDRLTTEAFENPFGNGGFRYRLSNLPWVDYGRVTDATPAEFDYTVQVLDNQGDLKRQIQTNTVQTYIDMADLPTGNYYVRAVFQNGSYTQTKTVIKQ